MRFFIRAVFLAAWATLLAPGCDRQPPAPSGPRLVIVGSVFPLASLADSLVGDWAQVRTLPGNGKRPAGELPAEALATLRQADVLLVAGNGDEWVAAQARREGHEGLTVIPFFDPARDHPPATAPATQPSTPGIPGTPGTPGIPAAAGSTIPVYPWMNLLLADRFVAELGKQLDPLFPDRRTPLRNRVMLLRTNVLMLDQEFETKFARLRNQKLVALGDTAAPLAQRYGLQLVATDGGAAQLVEAIRGNRLAVVYSQNGGDEQTLDAIRRAAGVEVLRLDPFGGPTITERTTYLEMMRTNLETLYRGQKKR